jgi:ATP-dependent Clp protease ATP-binding subunit ClpC
MQPPLTESARKVLDESQVEARHLNQEFVGTEHLLLALLKGQGTHASRVLRAQHVDKDAVRSSLLSVMSYSENDPVVSGNLPLSPKAQRAVNAAIVMARSLRENKVSTRVLLLALMDEQGSAFISALRQAGADVESLLKALAAKPNDEEA